jgi:hypothetical protein
MTGLIITKATNNHYSERVFFAYCTKVLDREFFKRKELIRSPRREKDAEKREYCEQKF